MEKKLITDFLKSTNDRHRRRIERKIEFNRMLRENALKFHQHTMDSFQSTIHLAINDIINERTVTGRKIRVPPQNNAEASELLFTLYSDSEYLESFHINRNTFNYIVELVRDELHFKPNFISTRKPLSVEFKTAIALYSMANNCQQSRVISKKFGIGPSTVHKCLHVFLDCVSRKLGQFICMPSPLPSNFTNGADDDDDASLRRQHDDQPTAHEVAEQFQNLFNIPNIIGCIYKSHITLNVRRLDHMSYLNENGDPSIVLQTVIDADHRFINISCVAPGSTPNALVLQSSELYKKSFNIPKTKDNESYMIIGGKGFPLLEWLLTKYGNGNSSSNNNDRYTHDNQHLDGPEPASDVQLTPTELYFNKHLDIVLKHCEKAILKMKNRWQIILNNTFKTPNNATKIIQTCCILHNICINQCDDYFDHHYHPDEYEPLDTDPNVRSSSSALHENDNNNDNIDLEIDETAQVKRDLIKNLIINNN